MQAAFVNKKDPLCMLTMKQSRISGRNIVISIPVIAKLGITYRKQEVVTYRVLCAGDCAYSRLGFEANPSQDPHRRKTIRWYVHTRSVSGLNNVKAYSLMTQTSPPRNSEAHAADNPNCTGPRP